jgi:hypothetical protein
VVVSDVSLNVLGSRTSDDIAGSILLGLGTSLNLGDSTVSHGDDLTIEVGRGGEVRGDGRSVTTDSVERENRTRNRNILRVDGAALAVNATELPAIERSATSITETL